MKQYLLRTGKAFGDLSLHIFLMAVLVGVLLYILFVFAPKYAHISFESNDVEKIAQLIAEETVVEYAFEEYCNFDIPHGAGLTWISTAY